MEPIENIEERWRKEHCRIESDSIFLIVQKQIFRVPLSSCDTHERILLSIRQLIRMDELLSIGHIDAFIVLACKHHGLPLAFSHEEKPV